jgi:hypothetical protein
MDKTKIKNVALIIIGILSLGYIGTILKNNLQSVDNIFKYISLESLGIAIIPSIMMLVTQSYLHSLIIEDVEARKMDHRLLVYSTYSFSQLIRYLPGKIWGIIYQSEILAEKFSKRTIWFSNLVQSILSSVNSIIVLGAVYLYTSFIPKIAIIYAILGILVLYLLISTNIIYRVSNTMLSSKYQLLQIPKLSRGRIFFEIIILQIEWLFYFITWYFLVPDNIQESGYVLIGTAYAAASLIGMLAFIMPNGWLVREASFIWLGGFIGLSQYMLLIYGVIARIIFILADIFWAVLAKIMSKIITKEALS